MIDDKRWALFMRGEDVPTMDELFEAMDERFTCPRCGRNDLPLALFPHHNKSCAYECAIGMPAIEKVEQMQERIDDLEQGVRDAMHVINWFGGWLNGRTKPVAYDNATCVCGHEGRDHTGLGRCGDPNDSECDCDVYRPTTFSVTYDARGVAIQTNALAKLIQVTDFRCRKCKGKFELTEHTGSGVCRWCQPQQAEVG